VTTFAARLLRWFDRHGRHDLPWQHPRTPYRVWLAEIMLQQTQVATVIPYYRRFLRRFPSIRSLATARQDDVLGLWSGLGYYARARNLHAAAKEIATRHGGRFPRDFEAVAALPGIGRSTAGAILAQAFGQRRPILDGNARRVFARHAGVEGWPGEPAVQEQLWRISTGHLPRKRLVDYTQALMDLGATLCVSRRPRCNECPLRGDCRALARDRVHAIPAPRPRKARPRRRAHLLLIENRQGAILMERRPSPGIWGGLWCPPLLNDVQLASGSWASELLAQAGAAQALPALRHAFTHFDLELQPLRIVIDAAPSIAEPDRGRWVTLSELRALGLPTPIRKLIEQDESIPT